MFVGLRDLRHARGRFTLMVVVVAMVAFLAAFLASLTSGLARESTSAVSELPADQLAFGMPEEGQSPAFTSSSVTTEQWHAWQQVDGVTSAEPLGVATLRATSALTTIAVAAMGVAPGSALLPHGVTTIDDDAAVLTGAAADALGLSPGDALALAAGSVSVTAVVESDASFSHTPAIWLSLDTWRELSGRGADSFATAIALTTNRADLDAADAAIGTTTVTTSAARSAVAAFAAENLTLTLIVGFLLAISALVVGAFFTVWTVGRAGDLAVLKALGASTRYLVRDALGQALVVLGIGVALGTLLATGAALALGSVAPVVVGFGTTAVPALLIVGLGLLGAAIATSRISAVDAHGALAAR
ncbi:MAG: ABC transporter permease [Cellulomonadaceae bacterium]|nr:ABC transporter permease [Cellulomonadaceae bacterium]